MTSRQVSSLWRLAARKADFIVLMGGTGDRIPFYCVHSISGDVSTLKPLAFELAHERRVYGIQIPKRFMNADFATSVGAIAERYVNALAALQPDGPVMLGGWSAGSFIALEMAQLLRRQGRCVALLVALDGFLYRKIALPRASYPHFCLQFAQNLPGWIGNKLSEPNLVGGIGRSISKRFKRSSPSIESLYPDRTSSQVDKFLDTSSWPNEQAAFVRILFDVIERYEPRRYSGPTIVYSAKVQHLFRPGQVRNQWKDIADSVEIIDVRGTHAAITQGPEVSTLAQHLRTRFREVDALVLEHHLAETNS